MPALRATQPQVGQAPAPAHHRMDARLPVLVGPRERLAHPTILLARTPPTIDPNRSATAQPTGVQACGQWHTSPSRRTRPSQGGPFFASHLFGGRKPSCELTCPQDQEGTQSPNTRAFGCRRGQCLIPVSLALSFDRGLVRFLKVGHNICEMPSSRTRKHLRLRLLLPRI
jgi:hypothetical protein